jgi:hypothetical protein
MRLERSTTPICRLATNLSGCRRSGHNQFRSGLLAVSSHDWVRRAGTERASQQFDEHGYPWPPSDAVLARQQSAIGRAHAAWVASLETNPPTRTMSPKGPSEYPANAYVVDASDEQLAALKRRIDDELRASAVSAP